MDIILNNTIMSSLQFSHVEDSIVILRNQRVILDYKVAQIYNVETKRVNEAVKNNPDKFPSGYVLELTNAEVDGLRSKISTTNISSKSRFRPKAFTEKGLYMLATILKSPQATQATLAIVETFAKVKELSVAVSELSSTAEEVKQKSLMRRTGEIITELIDNDMKVSDTETTIEFNFALLKVKHTVKRKGKD